MTAKKTNVVRSRIPLATPGGRNARRTDAAGTLAAPPALVTTRHST